jgi:hypothetical protein
MVEQRLGRVGQWQDGHPGSGIDRPDLPPDALARSHHAHFRKQGSEEALAHHRAPPAGLGPRPRAGTGIGVTIGFVSQSD